MPPSDAPQILARPAGEARVLPYVQERLWYLHQLHPTNPVYNMPFVSRLRGDLSVPAFTEALRAVVDRHEILRTVFLVVNGQPRPFPLKKGRAPLTEVDLRHLPASDREQEAQRFASEEAARSFDMTREPMFRCVLYRLSDDEFWFVHSASHMVFEGGSVAALYNDLAAAYEQALAGRTIELPPLPYQYADFSAWQRRSLSAEREAQLTEYWKVQLANPSTLDLPFDFPMPPVNTFQGERWFFHLDRASLEAIKTRFPAVSPYRLMAAAFNLFLNGISGSTDLFIGSPFMPYRGLEGLVGFFVNTVVLRTSVAGDPSFRELLLRTEQVVRLAKEHCELMFHKVVEAVQPPRDPSGTPLFQVNFRAPGRPPYPALQLPGIRATPADYLDNGTSKFNLSLEVETSVGEPSFFEYRTDLFRRSTIEHMRLDFEQLLRAVAEQPDKRISELAVIRDILRRYR